MRPFFTVIHRVSRGVCFIACPENSMHLGGQAKACPTRSVHWSLKAMRNQWKYLVRIVVTVGISGLFFPVNGADAKPDPKKSQAAYQRGLRADQAGKRDEAIGD